MRERDGSPATSAKPGPAGAAETNAELSAAERLRFFSLCVDMLCISSGDGYFKWLNPAFSQTLGWTVEELLTRPYVDFVHPDDLAATIHEVERQVSAGEKVFHFENRYRHKDGSWRVLSWMSAPEGKLMYAVARDVTERSRLEHSLEAANAELEQRVAARTIALEREVDEHKRSEARILSLLRAAPDPKIIVGMDGNIQLANDRVLTNFGHEPKELLGSSIETLLPALTADDGDIGKYLLALESKDSARLVSLGRRKDGSEFPVEISLSTDRSDDDPVVIFAVRDITDRRAVEAQLRQAQKMEAIGNLTGGMAHDFNNLLGVIIGNIDLLRERLADDAAADQLADEALSAALRGAELTQRLLAFARRQPLQPRLIQPNDLLAGIVKLLRRTLGEPIEIVLDLSPEVSPILVDPAQLESSITNLANNARDAMPKGGKLTVATANRHLDADYAASHAELRAGDYVLIEVSDSGAGIAADAIEHIFEPFFTTKEQGKGTGLGLSMVFGFVKQSGGHINVYSEVGVGTTFKLYLPQAEAVAAADGDEELRAPVRRGDETVLVVEDNAGLRAVVMRQLTELGYTVLEAESGPAALAVLEAESVDLLFTDVIMPGGLNGYELGGAARSRWPAIRVLLTSGFPEEKINGNAAAHWNMRLLIKPYRKDELARAVRDVMDER
jgi:PAS domain S-box-containing protein